MEKVYLASKFPFADRVAEIAETLKEHGIEITKDWWNFDYKTLDLPDDEWYRHPDVVRISQENFKAIDRADALVIVANGDDVCKFNGANVELGYAIAKGKPCYSIGKLDRSAMYAPVLQLPSVEAFIDRIREEKEWE